MHLGDIKAGSSSPCTDEYFATIRGLFDTFEDPLVYTPGDNEWTDCHVAIKNNGLYTPTERLQAVRTLFFPVPGQTLGGRKKEVDNPFSASPADAAAHALHPSTPVAENVTRMVVEGSDGRTEYVRLTMDPKPTTGSIFSWDRVPLQ